METRELLSKIERFDAWPAPFEEGEPMWDDPYISSHMLRAHLDESNDKASYRASLRAKVAARIIKKCALKSGDALLDLGCGPGLYAKQFAQRGINYTGVDISNQSLGYAMAHKGEYASLISYIKADYTEHVFGAGQYDCAAMIWCDFGALSPEKRDNMLKNVRRALKSGGMFCFDVYAKSSPFEQSSQGWRIEEGGFWQEGLYMVLERSKYYEDAGAGLYSAIVVSDKGVKPYRVWDRRYSKTELADVLRNAGFGGISIKKGGLSGSQKDMYGVFIKS